MLPVVILGCALAVAAPAAAQPTAVPGGFFAGYGAEAANPGGDPPGVNDWDCRLPPEHPRPVVLLHGTAANAQINWNAMAPALKSEGYCLFAPTFGVLPTATSWPMNVIGGLGSMYDSAALVREFVEKILAATGSNEVDIVAHSEGTLVGGYYVKFLGGADVVDKYVALTPPWKGNEAYGAGVALDLASQLGVEETMSNIWDPIAPALLQMAKGSDFMNEMTESGPYAPGVTYTNVMTRYDELVMPYTAGYVEAPNATNIVMQDSCEQDFSVMRPSGPTCEASNSCSMHWTRSTRSLCHVSSCHRWSADQLAEYAWAGRCSLLLSSRATRRTFRHLVFRASSQCR
ncbi:lipase [Rhodococcus sp. H36-A4]|uniref:esterase/lipase family protein n=1 Tax=Rhodococcus sp. H36-A4 TaxID=3004353 RepID=UPI0022B0252B|nr:alpha/beta fold hydrolase [Rhodococcus sp. H36-A4]MCZ4076424.1 lipase [Rhodococcus sp. H36-A4]